MNQGRHVDTFLSAYPPDFSWAVNDTPWKAEDTVTLLGADSSTFTEFNARFAAPSHAKGIVKFFSAASKPTIYEWNSDGGWKLDWPQWRDRLIVFGYDWNGSLLGFDPTRKRGGEALVGILEPDTGELLQTPHSFGEFLFHAATDEADAALSVSYYREWINGGGAIPKPGFCAGCKVPLFLNGSDTVDNLALQDLAVYVSLCGQIYTESRKRPPGIQFSGVRIS